MVLTPLLSLAVLSGNGVGDGWLHHPLNQV
jgi:hypothetical protein